MEQEHRRIKREVVSSETRRGQRRAAVNPNARKLDEADGQANKDARTKDRKEGDHA